MPRATLGPQRPGTAGWMVTWPSCQHPGSLRAGSPHPTPRMAQPCAPPALCPRSPSAGRPSNSCGCAARSSSSGKRQAGHRCRPPSFHPPSLSPPPAPAWPHQRPVDARAGPCGLPCTSHLHVVPGATGDIPSTKTVRGEEEDRTATSEAIKTSFPSSPGLKMRAGARTMASPPGGVAAELRSRSFQGQFRAALSGNCHHCRGRKDHLS